MVLRCVVLLVGVLACAPCARADELRQALVDLVRSTDCALALERIAGVFTVMGHDEAQIEAAVDGLIASGQAGLSPDRRELVLSEADCRPPVELPVRVAAVPWIEERLTAAPGCRRPLDELADEARMAGVPPEEFGRAVHDLTAIGRYLAEDGALGLRADLCAPGRAPDRPLARIEGLGPESLRAVIGILAMERGCRLPLGDRSALLEDLRATASTRLLPGAELSVDAAAALERRLDATLEDPGPVYRIDRAADEIVAIYCRR